MLLISIGCVLPETRTPAPEEAEREKEPPMETIGDIITFGNAEPVPVSGVGLVVNLEGTGGDAPTGSLRTFMEDYLRKRGVERAKEVLASPDNSLVLVSGQIPPGAHKGDIIDVEITLPPQSKTTSLRGGYLKECVLYNYDTTHNLSPTFAGSNRPLLGHPLAKAEGPLLLATSEEVAAPDPKKARVWGGGRSNIDRPFFLIINGDQQRVSVVQQVADRINSTFHGPYNSGHVAVAKTKSYLILGVPPQYKLNLPRYLRVVRLIPLRETPAKNSPYCRWLERELLDPAHTVTAALRLEALGSDSIPILKQGLESTHPLVRFTSAEALAYLGSPACGEQLAALAEKQPLLRAFSLTAMASLDEAICHVKLRELLASPEPETRYGAFRALRALDEHDPAVQGEQFNGSFWLHRVSPESTPLVHLATSRRAEVVIFGEEPYMVPPFQFLAGEFTVTAGNDDKSCTISRLSAHRGTSRRQCSLKLDDVLHTMADMGCMYPEVVELLRQVGNFQCLSCKVAIDAVPQSVTVETLVAKGTKKPAEGTEEILKAQDDFGDTPNLYEKGAGSHTKHVDKEADEPKKRKPSPGDKDSAAGAG
jgi:hypothetical protein